MTAFATSLVCIAGTALALGILAWRDSMRRRGDAARGWSKGARRLLGGAALLPGAGLAVTGSWAAFAVWCAGVALSGWLVARVPAIGAGRRP